MLRERVLNFNWRLAIARTLVNALALGLTVLLLPGLRIMGDSVILTLLIAGLVFGILNALIRPVLQFIMFNFLFATFGLVLVIINFILLYLLGWLTPGLFASDGWTWLVLGAVLLGLFGILFENLLGLTPPVIDAEPEPAIKPALNEAAAQRINQLLTSDTPPAEEDES
jgi:putative membrane protein